MINLAIENTYLRSLEQARQTVRRFILILKPSVACSVDRGFFISTNSHRFTHPRPIDKIGYQIGVLGIDRIS